MPTSLVLDCDTGTDDAVAIMVAALHPELALEAVTTVHGNVEVNYCTDNSLRVLDHIGRSSIPVYEGAASPIARLDHPTPRARWPESNVHGRHLDLPEATSTKQDGSAAEFLVRHFARAASQGDDVTLVAVGPLTNVALAIKLDPMFASNVRRLVIMGGSHDVQTVTVSAEFNIWCDPEGAQVVMTSGIEEIVLVTIDATHRALVSSDDCKRFHALGTPAAEATAIIVERRIRGYAAEHPVTNPPSRAHTAPVHDALCIAYLVDPSVISTNKCRVDVETKSDLTVGRTVIDTRSAGDSNLRGAEEPNAWVALDADEAKFVELLMETFAIPHGGAVS
jgi:inosine-uridine nucleoside N-ribohydrolase